MPPLASASSLNRTEHVEGSLCESGHRSPRIVVRFAFCRRHVASRLEQPPSIEPVDPRQRGKLDRIETAPRALPENHLRFEQRVTHSASSLS